MKRSFLKILLLLLSYSASSAQLYPEYSCTDLLERYNLDGFVYATGTTVELGDLLEGKHGGKRQILKLTGLSWQSMSRSQGKNNPQGSAIWFIATMGEVAARFFGFEIVDQETILIPDIAEFNGALLKINQFIHDNESFPPIPFSLCPDTASNVIYLQGLAERLCLPYGENAHEKSHDIAFHLENIFMPPKYLFLAQQRARQALKEGGNALAEEVKVLDMALSFKARLIYLHFAAPSSNRSVLKQLYQGVEFLISPEEGLRRERTEEINHEIISRYKEIRSVAEQLILTETGQQ